MANWTEAARDLVKGRAGMTLQAVANGEQTPSRALIGLLGLAAPQRGRADAQPDECLYRAFRSLRAQSVRWHDIPAAKREALVAACMAWCDVMPEELVHALQRRFTGR
jgi:hypothetical protein